MIFRTIANVSNFIDNPRIRTFHWEMFHGISSRDGRFPPKDKTVWGSETRGSPLVISRTSCRVPSVSQPSTHLVVNEDILSRLSHLPGIRFSAVDFERVVEIEWQKGDMTWADKRGHGNPRNLLTSTPDIPALHETIGRFFELQTWRLQDVLVRYPNATSVEIEVGAPPMHEPMTIRLCADLLHDFPIIWNHDIIISEEAFSLIGDSLDHDFFFVRKYDLP